MQRTRLNWYYERLQATGRSQSRLLWAGIVLSFGALLILFAPDDAKQIKFLDFPFQSIESILPAIIFLLLVILQGSFIAARDSLNNMNKLIPKNQQALTGVYEIDKNLNFVDYLAFIFKRKWLGKIVEPLLYPLCILLIAFPAVLLLCKKIGMVITASPNFGAAFLLCMNLLFGFFCYMVSRQFFKDRWKRFRQGQAKKRRLRR